MATVVDQKPPILAEAIVFKWRGGWMIICEQRFNVKRLDLIMDNVKL